MTQEPSTLYAKLLGETAEISWKELEPFFAKVPYCGSMPAWI